MLARYDLHRTVKFNPSLGSLKADNKVEEIFKSLPINKTHKVRVKKAGLNSIICNLRYSVANRSYLSYNRTTRYYSSIPARYNREFMAYNIMIPLIDGLKDIGAIENVNGFKDVRSGKGMLSKLRVADGFEDEIKSLRTASIEELKPKELIVLKSRECKIPLVYEETHETKRMRDQLEKYNDLRQSHEFSLSALTQEELEKHEEFLQINSKSEIISGEPIQLKNPYVYRVFNDDFTMGGRYYNGIETNMSKELRKKLLINGEPCVEVDYSSYHIRILYHLIGIDYKCDAYGKVSEGDSDMRKIFKIVGLCTINTTDKSKSLGAIRQQIINNGLKDSLPDLTNDTINKLLDMWETEHFQIKKYFHSDTGIKLQNLDSKITQGLISSFTDQNEVILGIHDSFIVRKGLEDVLKDYMIENYKLELNYRPVIAKIK